MPTLGKCGGNFEREKGKTRKAENKRGKGEEREWEKGRKMGNGNEEKDEEK